MGKQNPARTEVDLTNLVAKLLRDSDPGALDAIKDACEEHYGKFVGGFAEVTRKMLAAWAPSQKRDPRAMEHLRNHAEIELLTEPENDTAPADNFDDQANIDFANTANFGNDWWPWCMVEVRVTYGSITVSEYLGGCSYDNAADFINGGYYQEMVDTALDRLYDQLDDKQVEIAGRNVDAGLIDLGGVNYSRRMIWTVWVKGGQVHGRIDYNVGGVRFHTGMQRPFKRAAKSGEVGTLSKMVHDIVVDAWLSIPALRALNKQLDNAHTALVAVRRAQNARGARTPFRKNPAGDEHAAGNFRRAAESPMPKKNPSTEHAPDVGQAIEKYVEFNRFDPKKIETVDITIPDQMVCVGTSKWVTYRSGKVDPDTLKKPSSTVDYIHEHDAGVKCYMPVAEVEGGEPCATPKAVHAIKALVRLGTCLGFSFEDEGAAVEAQSTAPMPELWTTPDGKALLVIQGKKKVLAVMTGGALGVEGRGIVG